jgi:hypothetical protein
MATESEARNALAKVQDPELGQSIVDLGMVRDLQVTDGSVTFTLALIARNPFERAQLLPRLGVDLLICGMISQTQQTALASAGIRIIPHICGRTEEVIAALLDGRIENGALLMPGCGGRKRMRNRMARLGRKEAEER